MENEKDKDKCTGKDEIEDKKGEDKNEKVEDEKYLPPLRVVAPHPATSTRVSIPPKLPLIINICFG